MSKIKFENIETRRILRLHESGKSKRFIAEYLGISHNAVTKMVRLHVQHKTSTLSKNIGMKLNMI